MPDYVQALNDKIQGTMATLIGLRVTYADPRRVAGEMSMRADLTQPYGYIHGGALMTLMDSLAGMGSVLNLPPGHGFTTIEFKINFLRSVRSGQITAEATAVHLGGRTHVWQVTAHDDRGQQLALATLTQIVIELRSEVES
jgi:1,4-dihydroxy-2-naphthoyl-CoA hydrolase